jgi:hypothetical protein|nr:MAG TPA: vimentin [Caudoviricetes sp.]
MRYIDTLDHGSLQYMPTYRLTPSVESFTYSEEGFLDAIKRIIPSIIDSFNNFAKKLGFDDKPLSYLSHVRQVDVKEVSKSQYTDIMDAIIPIPQYYTGTYLAYISLLNKFSDVHKELLFNMETFQKNLGIALSSPTGLNQDFSSDLKRVRQLKQERQSLKEEMAALFTGRTNVVKTSYGNVIKRNADVLECAKVMAEVADKINAIDNKKVVSTTKDLAEQLNAFKKHISSKDVVINGKTVPDYFVESTLELAEEIEFYALTRYQYSIFKSLFEEMLTTVIKALR